MCENVCCVCVRVELSMFWNPHRVSLFSFAIENTRCCPSTPRSCPLLSLLLLPLGELGCLCMCLHLPVCSPHSSSSRRVNRNRQPRPSSFFLLNPLLLLPSSPLLHHCLYVCAWSVCVCMPPHYTCNRRGSDRQSEIERERQPETAPKHADERAETLISKYCLCVAGDRGV